MIASASLYLLAGVSCFVIPSTIQNEKATRDCASPSNKLMNHPKEFNFKSLESTRDITSRSPRASPNRSTMDRNFTMDVESPPDMDLDQITAPPLCDSFFFSMTFQKLLAIRILFDIGFRPFRKMLPVIAQEHLGFNPSKVGLLMSVIFGFDILASMFCVGRISSRISEYYCISFGLVMMLCAYIGFSQVNIHVSVWFLILLLWPMELGSSVFYTTVLSLATKATGANNMAKALSFMHSSWKGVGIISPTLGGFLIQSYGASSLGSFGAMFSITTLVFQAMVLSKKQVDALLENPRSRKSIP